MNEDINWSELELMEAAMDEITNFGNTLGTPKPIDWDAVHEEECRELLEVTDDLRQKRGTNTYSN